MNKKIVEELKRRLEERKKEVIAQLESIGARAEGEELNFNAEFPQYGDSAEDNAIEVADYAKNVSIEKEMEKELRDIEQALRDMAEGNYGVCHFCNQEIGIDRLMVRPESRSCVSCKNAISGRR